MGKITTLNEKAICCTVQSLAWGFDIWEATMNLKGYKKGDLFLSWINGTESENERLPPGLWSILGRPEEITEEQWKGIVEPRLAWNYMSDAPGAIFDTYLESGLSLLKSKGLNPIEIIILIKQ